MSDTTRVLSVIRIATTNVLYNAKEENEEEEEKALL